jgi:hypothetical protein
LDDYNLGKHIHCQTLHKEVCMFLLKVVFSFFLLVITTE